MKNTLIIIGVIILLLVGMAWWSKNLQEKDPSFVSRNGLHWHPELKIYVKDIEQQIPQNIGLGAVHMPMHTHDDPPIIHLEFQGMVREQDLLLGQFFKNWNKDMYSFGTNMTMMVNGQENTDYENYIMRDKDKIELRFN